MKEINLRDFYPWHMEDVMVEVTEEVAEELLAGQRYIKASRRRVYRNKAHYSLDAEDGIEYSACFSNPSPQELIERMERFEYLCHALNSLPDAQGQRVFEHYLLGHPVKAIAAAEGVTERADQSPEFLYCMRLYGSPLRYRRTGCHSDPRCSPPLPADSAPGQVPLPSLLP